jgi:HEPN domain-containing protein
MSARRKLPVETPREWIRHADENLGVAEREMRYDAPAYHTVCFLCQSAAEKYLKGYLVAQGWTLKKTHDIAELLELCIGYDPEFEGLLNEGIVLNEYITEGRYPGDIAFESIGDAEAQEAVGITRRIRGMIVGKLPVDNNTGG